MFKLAFPFASFVTHGAVDFKLVNFTFDTFVIDVLKFVSFRAAVRTASVRLCAERCGQTRVTVVLTTAHNEIDTV